MTTTLKTSPFTELSRLLASDMHSFKLTNESLKELLQHPDLTEDDKERFFTEAYQRNHPYIYPPAPTAFGPHEYTLNFLWINLNPQDRVANIASTIFNEMRQEEAFIERLSEWADRHPGAYMNLWYDSALVTEKARQNTLEKTNHLATSKGVDLKLRDIRYLPSVEGEIKNALHPGTPLYFRIDLLKTLIADHCIHPESDAPTYCVFSDIDIEPMTPSQLFNERTLRYLSTAGYVFQRLLHAPLSFENSFFIFNKTKPDFHKIHREHTTDTISDMLSHGRHNPAGFKSTSHHLFGSQSIYDLYKEFLSQRKESKDPPRAVVRCPSSQFFNRRFTPDDHKSEKFRFVGDDTFPHVCLGRNYSRFPDHREAPIDRLDKWIAEPLPQLPSVEGGGGGGAAGPEPT